MNNFNFGEVLTRAWQIIWKHKVLWVFGILASCARGGGSGGGGGGGGRRPSGQSPFPQFDQAMEQLGNWIGEHLWIVVAASCLVLLLILLFIFLGTIGKIGLIKGTYQAEQGAEQLILGELFSGSMPYFWRVFGLSFLIGLAFLIVFIPIILFGIFTGGIGFACILPLLCILIPVAIVVGVIIEQANNAMVLEELGIMDGLRRGWEVVKSNIGAVIVMAIILGVIGVAVGLVFAIPIFIIVFPAAFAFAIGNAQNSTPLILAGVCFCLYLPVLVLLQGVLTAYVQSAWTLTFMRLTNKSGGGDQPKPEDNKPPEPEDSNKTVIATRSNA